MTIGLRLVCRTIDLDVFVTAHRREWDRLDELTRHSRSLSGAEVDELVDLYQRTATHLSAVRTSAPDPVLVARLSGLVTRAARRRHRARCTGLPRGRHRSSCGISRRRCTARGGGGSAPAPGSWSSRSPWRPGWRTTRTCSARSRRRRRCASSSTRTSRRTTARTRPARSLRRSGRTTRGCRALAIASGALLGIPIPFLLWQNAANVGLIAGLMAAHGRLDLFFGLVLPHGLLELTAVFIASGVRAAARLDDHRARRPAARCRRGVAGPGRDRGGHRPGRRAARVGRHRGVRDAVRAARRGRGSASGWSCGSAFLAYVVVLGGRAARAGDTGDLDPSEVGDVLPSVG